jgi:hypothetical protein
MMSTTHSDLEGFLAELQSSVGVSEEITRRLTELEDGAAVGVGIGVTIAVPIVGGKGSATTEKKTTFGATITGSATITSPPNGTWDVIVEDIVAGKTVFQGQGIAPNQPIQFSYKTGFSAQLRTTAVWSEGGNTTLVVEVKAST